MSNNDKEQLKELIKKYSFNDIIDELLEQKAICSMDIISIAREYENSENNNTAIEQIHDILNNDDEMCHNMISCNEFMRDIVLQYYDTWDVLEYFDNEELLDKLDGSYELEHYVDYAIEQATNEINNEQIEELNKIIKNIKSKKGLFNILKNIELSSDDIHQLICEITSSNRYDKNTNQIIDKLKELLNKNNTYNIKY